MGDAQSQPSAPLGVLPFAPSAIQQPADAGRDQEQGGGLGHSVPVLRHYERLEVIVPAPNSGIETAGVAARSRDIRVVPVPRHVPSIVQDPDAVTGIVWKGGVGVEVPGDGDVVEHEPWIRSRVTGAVRARSRDEKVDARSPGYRRIDRHAYVSAKARTRQSTGRRGLIRGQIIDGDVEEGEISKVLEEQPEFVWPKVEELVVGRWLAKAGARVQMRDRRGCDRDGAKGH